MKTKYVLEIYEPDDDSCVAGLYESDNTFGALHVGHEINGFSLNMTESQNSVKITKIEHILWEVPGSHITHKICVSTKLA
ncbi:hypothetical protein QDQ61_18860 [Citrobacter freundii]|uniref:hypothetical protein n=1 Tax=Citrobacter freundii complex TaxID=1344959 RepID=UPI0008FD4FD0|nr:hypothetical protein [Citrobacter freundii]EFK2498501.1 hypothetical protein [Escherichia coli]HBR0811525.1 hypothetical protein [Klebsiella pneumoniae]EKW3669275.1 hypothetical protein [Citrobacter freundii]ELK7472252.1 hypothetical protein [Citrobacter freundii]MBJ9273961.1 hypothetical protein [Citrobacter freundii]